MEIKMTSKPEWFYNEMIHSGVDYSTEEEVSQYDEKMSRFRNFEEEAQDIIEALDIRENDRVLDMGTGTGEIAMQLSGCCDHVYAVDVSGAMLGVAEKKAASRGCTNISFIHGGFLSYEHGNEAVDAVVSQIALHHLPDFWKLIALQRIHSMLRDGGRFYLRDIVFSMNMEKYEKTIDYSIGHFKEIGGEKMSGDFIRHLKSEFSTFDWIMEEMLYRAGFNLERADYLDNHVAVYVCSKRAAEK